MFLVPANDVVVAPVLEAGLLLAALVRLTRLGLPRPTAAAILEATGASKTRAYEVRAALEDQLPGLLRAPGRPSAPPPQPVDTGAITREAYAFLRAHPGAAITTRSRQRYSDGFRCLVLDLAERHPDLHVSAFADAVGVPAATVQDWLAAPVVPCADPSASLPDDVAGPQVESIVEHWRRWGGGFSPFCAFVRRELAIPYGDTLISRILAVHADRRPVRRPGRSPDEKALRDAFVTFFPGAQWVEDGSPISCTLNGEPFTFNLELCVDAYTGAFVGASLRDQEDGAAVAEAFTDAVATTGAPPVALSTDNRASNFAPDVEDAIGDTIHIRATAGRPQNDAPVEGAFGLFQQTAPPLRVEGTTPRELALSIFTLMFTTWARVCNHRPRTQRGGKSRFQLYRDEQPTEAQIAAAKAALEERRRRQALAHATRQARLNPVVRAMLEAAFTRLCLNDPTGKIKDAIARYSSDIVVAAIATFDGKRRAGTLPHGAGGRYLLGIARNIARYDEGIAAADELWIARLQARDRALVRLDEERRTTAGTTTERVQGFIERALAADGPLHRPFWLRATSDAIQEAEPAQHETLYRLAARRIHAAFRVDARERQAAVRAIAAQVLPIA